MTQEIIEMAQECGLIGMRPHLDGIYSEALVAFAKLVAEAEREACANKERLAQPEPIQSLQCFHCQVTIETLNDKVMHLMAQRTEQKPDYWLGYGLQAYTEKPFEYATALYRHPPQRTEQNFCSRCGKRTKDLITIHTCTPPKD